MTLAEEAGFSVYLVRQDPDTAGPPHDHRMTAVIAMVDGVEIHRHYKREGPAVVETAESLVGPGETLVLGPDAVHAIANPDREALIPFDDTPVETDAVLEIPAGFNAPGSGVRLETKFARLPLVT